MAEAKRQNEYNLTEGGIFQKLMLVSLPVIGSQLVQMTYNLTDMFWLGRLSSKAVAASGTVGMYMWLTMAFLTLGARGAEIGVAQNLGRGDEKAARAIAQSSFSLSLMLGVLVSAVMILFKEPLIGFFNIADAQVAADARSYLWVVSLGIPFTFASAAVVGVFNGSGNSRLPFFINLISLGTNMVLDPIFIFPLKMGIMGAAVATVIAQVLGFVLLVRALKFAPSRPFEKFKLFAIPKKAHLKTIFTWTVPMSIEGFLFTFLSMWITRFVTGWGTDAMATQRIGSQVESLSWLIAGGYSMALTAFVGQNFGAGKWDRIRRGVSISIRALLVYGVIISGVMFFGARLIYGAFTPNEPKVIEMGVTYLRILAACQLLACLEAAAAGAFRGVGKTVPPSVVSITVNLFRVVAAYILSNHTPLGLNGIWWAVSAGAAVRGLWMFIWYMKSQRKMAQAR